MSQALSSSPTGVPLKQIHALVSASAVASLSKDAAMGALRTAMHKYGPDHPCHEVPNASMLQGLMKQLHWHDPPQLPGQVPAQAPDHSKGELRKVHSSIRSLEKQLANLSTQVSRAPHDPDHVILSKQSIHELNDQLNAIQTQSLEELVEGTHTEKKQIQPIQSSKARSPPNKPKRSANKAFNKQQSKESQSPTRAKSPSKSPNNSELSARAAALHK